MNPDPVPGLYVHVPFCSALCPYCDFAVNVTGKGRTERLSRYVGLLKREIELRGAPPAPADTIYFGGGTPSSLPASSLSEVVETLMRRGFASAGARLFLEANPEDVTKEAVRQWKVLGVRTLSLGIQSLDHESLRFLGRRHSAERARGAFELARQEGFGTLSIDLIYGLPGQSEARWREDLERAAALAPDHLSCYQLTVHEQTLFGRKRREGRLVEAGNELQADRFRLTHLLLEERGYHGYEVSSFARAPEHRSRHNEKYWSHVPYVGIGPSAHSFDGGIRSWNARSFFEWSRRIAAGEIRAAGKETLGEEELLLETLMLRLRTRDGLDLDLLRRRFGVSLAEPDPPIVRSALRSGLLVRDGSRLRPTLDGLAVADGLASSLAAAFEPCPSSTK